MKKLVSHDMIYYTGVPEAKKNFDGEDSLSPEERDDYLKHYEAYCGAWYGDEALDQKAATMEEAEAFCKNLRPIETKVRKTVPIETMYASARVPAREQESCVFYTGAYLSGDTVVLPKKGRPGPAAKLRIPETEELTLSFDLFISEDGKSEASGDVAPGAGGRVVELRSGARYIVKVKFFASGEIRAFQGPMWGSRMIGGMGNLTFGAVNHVEITVGETATVSVNGNTASVAITEKGAIDNLFFDSGMMPHGECRVNNIRLSGKPYDFGKPVGAGVTEDFGTVKLPYAIGTEKNADKELILEGSFMGYEAEKAYLCAETLDPCGEIWINGSPVLATDSFEKNRVDVTDVCKRGKNTIRVKVPPRAPENYYYWHRHSDCYNGWFCGELSVEFTSAVHVSELRVVTESVTDKAEGKIAVTLSSALSGTVKFTARKIFPVEGPEILLGCSAIHGTAAEFRFSGYYDVWSDEEPNLYLIRATLIDAAGREIDDAAEETGFRTICQKDGAVYLNGKRTILSGALIMQFLPPLSEIPVNHNCPTTAQIAWEGLMAKRMNANFLRLHMLGCGTNEARYARVFDRMGLMCCWITRYIDTLESMVHEGAWEERQQYLTQMKSVINHPSIVMWEGSNEFHPHTLSVIDRIYDEFTEAVTGVDETRLLCPVSHLYYGGGLYDSGCVYYGDDGTKDESGNRVKSGKGWTHPLVVRSTHPYVLLCGYGTSWEMMQKQNWNGQKELLESKEHAYMATEFAITSLPNPNTPEAIKTPYVRSYEFGSENRQMGRIFSEDEWRESQALAALCAFNAAKKLRLMDIDGMTWCCLSSGANSGSYMKPPIDFYGYKKLPFYSLREAYRKVFSGKGDIDVCYGSEDPLTPVIFSDGTGGTYRLTVEVIGEETTDRRVFDDVTVAEGETSVRLPAFLPAFGDSGYYEIRFILEEKIS